MKKIIKKYIIRDKVDTIIFYNKKNNSIIKCVVKEENENQFDNEFLKELEYTLKYQNTIGPKVLCHHVEYEYNGIQYFGFEMQNVGKTLYNHLHSMSIGEKLGFLNQHRQQFEDIFKTFSDENMIYLDINLQNFTVLDNKIYLIDFEPRFILKLPCYSSEGLLDVMKCFLNLHLNKHLQIRHFFKTHFVNVLEVIQKDPNFSHIYNHYSKD